MKQTKIVVAIVVCVIMLAGMMTGTVAWLTVNQSITNTFTTGNIQMTLTETKIGSTERTDKGQSYKVIPGAVMSKDPIVTITMPSERCYVFVCIEDGLNQIVPGCATLNIDGARWKAVATKGNKTMYQYENATGNKIVDASTADRVLEAVFTTVTINGEAVTATNIGSLQNKTITVKAYAHQSDNIAASEVLASAKTYFGLN